jgi:bacterial/archaeal transporter family-2 protein
MISGMAASLLPMIFGIAIGFGLPIQTAINSQLRKVLRSPFKASLVSFIVGTLVLWLIVTFAEGGSYLPKVSWPLNRGGSGWAACWAYCS